MVKFVNEFDAAKAAEALEPAFAVIDPASHQYPASFGTDMAREFLLADDISSSRVQLNGGAYGATPAIVIDAAAAIRKLMDRDPDHFIEDLLPHAYTHAATELTWMPSVVLFVIATIFLSVFPFVPDPRELAAGGIPFFLAPLVGILFILGGIPLYYFTFYKALKSHYNHSTMTADTPALLSYILPTAALLTGANVGTHIALASVVMPGLVRAGVQASRPALIEIFSLASRVQPSINLLATLACGTGAYLARYSSVDSGPLISNSLTLGAIAGLGMFAWTFTMHIPLNKQMTDVSNQTLTAAQLDDIGKKWIMRQWIRTSIVGVAFASSLYAYSLAK
ncbi:hypothetical protein GQ42DRAFT_156693 [Ramicandelaber brevisporus]|nr:hypothetical protein GQ42DRAFT_156693 [Ramicandelaber brevisporus]